MPLIDTVGRRGLKVKVLIAFMYLALVLGGITMVYPFMLMLSSSITSDVDFKEFRVIPRYFYNENVLFQKYVMEKYSTQDPDINILNERYGTNYLKFEEVALPAGEGLNIKTVEKDWQDFTGELPLNYKMSGFRRSNSSSYGMVEKLFVEWIKNKYKTLDNLNKAHTREFINFGAVKGYSERLGDRAFILDESTEVKDALEFKKTLGLDYFYFVSGEGRWITYLSSKYTDIADLNIKNKTDYKKFEDIVLESSLSSTKLKADWKEFVMNKFPVRYMSIDNKAEKLFHSFLENKYKTINKMNLICKTSYRSFKNIPLSSNLEDVNDKVLVPEIDEFIKKDLPAGYLQIKTTENRYREFLKKRYKNIEGLNSAYGGKVDSFDNVKPPYAVMDHAQLMSKKNDIKKYFLTRNYKEVVAYIVINGRAVLNTFIFCLAVVLTVLTVNPLCAYALARFNLSYGNKVLVFLLATMAFPAEVGMIPSFLLIKDLHMLNTYWALILPGLVNGYSIFILKGFFDSLPKEFYEAAQMDGASELRIFFNITLPLAKPIMAYLALGAFVSAYSAFMFAMLICQDPKMWTLMVWLYQMQQWAEPWVIMAALVITSIPTLLIFIFAQRVIMKGIIIPMQH